MISNRSQNQKVATKQMSILINKNTKVLIQGITGREAAKVSEEMKTYGTNILAGVTPGKGGQHILGIPVFDTVLEAKEKYPEIQTSLITVPARAVKDAAEEALDAGIPLLNILAENVPVQDAAYLYAKAVKQNALIIGPSSIGIFSPGIAKIGSIGMERAALSFSRGSVGIISKSGGMSSEIAHTLTQEKIGQSTIIGIGGDQIPCTDFFDLLLLFEKDPLTDLVVLFGEVGGGAEERVAEAIEQGLITKPVIALIVGKFAEKLPQGTVLGHAGSIVMKGKGSYRSKIAAFAKAKVPVAQTLEELLVLIQRELCGRMAR